MSALPTLCELDERDEIEQLMANGELCEDGRPHSWRLCNERYGADADGNRGVWVTYRVCRKCGEESA
jgi:hypothetical protein